MFRTLIVGASLAAAGLMMPRAASAQTPGHAHDHAADQGHGHSHAGAPVDCATLTTPPWIGLPPGDRQQISAVQQSVAHLNTPEAAIAAGFRPVLGNIPGMGVHYIHSERTRAGVDVNEPDHLLFAPVEGEERLVGVAYAFQDVVDTDVEIPFESDLAHWHDHPEFAGGGQTLHMLHVWFVPSSNGPFAGLNFYLPFHGAGIAAPSGCWMTDDATSERIQQVAFALAATENGGSLFGRAGALRNAIAGARGGAGARAGAAAPSEERRAARAGLIAALDEAAGAEDRAAWNSAADRYLADLTALERTTVNALLRSLTMAQMSTPEREAVRSGDTHQH
jgi:hypothetical protein